ncbi:MAG: hypothetical protein FWF57_02585 [Defluviitaleaceae bacterium]|nr:hypothetical protein [Defluviitaleaceae bacterium]
MILIYKNNTQLTADEAIKNVVAADSKELIKLINEICNTKYNPISFKKILKVDEISKKTILNWATSMNYIAEYISNKYIKEDNLLRKEVEYMLKGFKEVKYYSFTDELEKNALEQGIEQGVEQEKIRVAKKC